MAVLSGFQGVSGLGGVCPHVEPACAPRANVRPGREALRRHSRKEDRDLKLAEDRCGYLVAERLCGLREYLELSFPKVRLLKIHLVIDKSR